MASSLGLRNWQRLLCRLGLVLPLLVGLQALIVALLMVVGLLPFELAAISAVQWASVWLGGASATALIVLWEFRLRRPEGVPRGDGSVLPAAIPVGITHEGAVFASGRHFMAVGFVTLALRWNVREGRTLLETLLKANEAVVLTLARSFDGQQHIYLAVPEMGDTPESAIEGVRRATLALHQALEQQRVEARMVVDELGVEQLYWLCVLGKAFHEDVQLHSEARLVTARVGSNPPRFLATFALQPERFEQPRGNHGPAGLIRLMESRRSFFLAISLTPVPPEVVTQRLRRLAARAPEMALLAEALGETVVTEGYAEFRSPAMAEAALLLRGRKEGLWQISCRLICAVADAPVLTENLGFTPHLLGARGFTETATTRISSSGHSVATGSLLNLIGAPKSERPRQRDHARGTQEELEPEEN